MAAGASNGATRMPSCRLANAARWPPGPQGLSRQCQIQARPASLQTGRRRRQSTPQSARAPQAASASSGKCRCWCWCQACTSDSQRLAFALYVVASALRHEVWRELAEFAQHIAHTAACRPDEQLVLLTLDDQVKTPRAVGKFRGETNGCELPFLNNLVLAMLSLL